MLAGWAYGAIYRNSHERTVALDGWLWTLQPSKTTPINRATDTHHPHEQPARVLQLEPLAFSSDQHRSGYCCVSISWVQSYCSLSSWPTSGVGWDEMVVDCLCQRGVLDY